MQKTHLREMLATRLGTAAAVATLLALAVWSLGYMREGARSAEEARALFDGPSIRSVAVSLSDLYRLNLVVDEALVAGGFTPDSMAEFRTAVDILYVRAVDFSRAPVQGEAELETALALMHHIVGLSDSASAEGFPDLRGYARLLADESQRARGALIRYLDLLHDAQTAALNGSVGALGDLTRLHLAFLAVILSVGVTALLLLRSEVLARQERVAAQARVAFLAYHDPLTELPNRARFAEIAVACFGDPGQRRRGPRHRPQGTLAFLDLDHFKEVNDTYGHEAGDVVLCHVARCLREAADACGGTPARLAGDEFAVLLPFADRARASGFARDLIAAAAAPVLFRGNTIRPRLSVGIAVPEDVTPTAPVSYEAMARAADFALYAAKQNSAGGQLRLFDADLAARLEERRSRLTALEKAVESGGLEVWLQPKVRLPDGPVLGFEALVRWRLDAQLIPPDEFISLAEESGLILEIDHFMLREATLALAAANRRAGTRLSVSVNLSALHMSGGRIVAQVAEALATSGLPAELLTLELTESVQVRDWGRVLATLEQLKALGCRLSLDDFGTGYSSLAYLRKMPADELKLDKSFVTELEQSQQARWIVDAVVDIARSLKMSVVVEGIESAGQARLAHSLGCEIAQGYHFGRPRPAEEALRGATGTDRRSA